jgi:soluble lytic murein transglycosylase
MLSPELENDPRMIRGQELWAVAAYDEAREEFDSLLDDARSSNNMLRTYQLAHFFRDIGANRESIVAGADLIVSAGVATQDAPPYIGRFRYPAYYIDLIQPLADRYGFSPLLMLSLMRQESLFNPEAISVADAKGLTQVIPSTAQYIAGELNWPDFQDRDLLRPYVSVAFGSFYLDEQLRLFEGNRAAAIAAYNAGPGYTLDWVSLSGGDVDALASVITFDETERYLKRIYSHYTNYRRLYGGE